MLEYKSFLDDNIRVYDGLAWEDFTADGEFLRKSNNDFCGILTDSQIEEAAVKIKGFAKAPFADDVYLRFGNLPKNGKSKITLWFYQAPSMTPIDAAMS